MYVYILQRASLTFQKARLETHIILVITFFFFLFMLRCDEFFFVTIFRFLFFVSVARLSERKVNARQIRRYVQNVLSER